MNHFTPKFKKNRSKSRTYLKCAKVCPSFFIAPSMNVEVCSYDDRSTES